MFFPAAHSHEIAGVDLRYAVSVQAKAKETFVTAGPGMMNCFCVSSGAKIVSYMRGETEGSLTLGKRLTMTPFKKSIAPGLSRGEMLRRELPCAGRTH